MSMEITNNDSSYVSSMTNTTKSTGSKKKVT